MGQATIHKSLVKGRSWLSNQKFNCPQIYPGELEALRETEADGGRHPGHREDDAAGAPPSGRRNLQAKAGRALGQADGQQERQHEDGTRSFHQVWIS